MDMKILEKLLDDTRNEVKEETQRKVCANNIHFYTFKLLASR